MNTTTQRFIRRMGDGVRDARYAISIERTGRATSKLEQIGNAVLAVAIGILLACALAHWIAEAV